MYGTLKSLSEIVSNGIPEGLSLEYKGSDVLVKNNTNALCKAVSAFANAVGGHLIFGIEANDGRPVRLDDGVSKPSRTDWIHQTINNNVFPPVEHVGVKEIAGPIGSYYVVSVPRSVRAPHQCQDNKYYKRTGSHSEPMAHYEIEDVRNRPRQAANPLRVSLVIRNQLAFLHLRNHHASDSIEDIGCRVAANVAFERDAIGSLQGRGIKLFQSGAERYFLLDSMNMMLENFANKKKRGEPRIDISVRYGFHGKQIKEKFVFYLNDWFDSAVVRPLDVMVLEELTKKIEGLSKNLEKIAQTASKLSSVADGTGLRLSQRTLRSFKGARQLFDPYEFDWLGYKIVLDVSNEDALALHQVFGTIQPEQMRQQNYRRLGRNLRAKFERVFKLPF